MVGGKNPLPRIVQSRSRAAGSTRTSKNMAGTAAASEPPWARLLGKEYPKADEIGTVRILLACGIGASTGFMAAGMRKVAKSKGLDCTIKAVSKSEIMDYADKIDILLLGPHFASEVPEIQSQVASHGVKVMAIDPDYYAALDGESILEDAYDLLDED